MSLSVDGLFGDGSVELTCPKCNRSFQVRLKEVLTEGSHVDCPGCGETIVITHTPETKESLRKVNQSLRDFERTLKRLGR